MSWRMLGVAQSSHGPKFYDFYESLGHPLVICYIAMENGGLIVDFPMKNGGSFNSYVATYQKDPERGSESSN